MIRHLPLPDENDQAVAGTLPRDPFDGLVEQDVSEVVNLSDKLWEKELEYSPRNGLAKTAANVALIVANHPDWRGSLIYDELGSRIMWADFPPLIAGMSRPKRGNTLTDEDYVYVERALRKKHQLESSKPIIVDGMAAAAKLRKVNPLTDYLCSLQWDGTPRVATWLFRAFNVDDTEYSRMVGQWWLISAVARALKPGCKADHMLVLEGKQGKGKSMALRILTGDDWFLENPPNFRDGKAVVEAITGKWIVEIGELDALKGAAETRVKTFLSGQRDKYRPAYARHTVDVARMQVFAGSTNERKYLTDPTGGRRFWPVWCNGPIDFDWLRDERDQLWAESVALYRAGAPWYPTTVEQVDQLSAQQEERHDSDAWERRIEEWLDARGDDDRGVTIGDVLAGALGLEPGKWDRSAQTRVGACLARLRWESHATWEGERRVRRYRPIGRGEEE